MDQRKPLSTVIDHSGQESRQVDVRSLAKPMLCANERTKTTSEIDNRQSLILPMTNERSTDRSSWTNRQALCKRRSTTKRSAERKTRISRRKVPTANDARTKGTSQGGRRSLPWTERQSCVEDERRSIPFRWEICRRPYPADLKKNIETCPCKIQSQR